MFGIDDAIIGAVGGSLVSGLLNNSAAEGRQADAQAFSAEQYASRYQTTVKDMQAAGLNPALAYGGISGSAPTSSAASSSGTPDLGSTISQAKMTSAQVANVAADTENKKAQANLIEAQAAQAWASASQSHAHISNLDASTAKMKEELKNIPLEGDRLKRAAHLLYEQSNLASQQQLTETQKYNMLKAQASKLLSETDLVKMDVEAAQALDNLGRTSKELKPVVDIIRGLIRK